MDPLIIGVLFVVAVVLLVVWMRAGDSRPSRSRHDCHDTLMTYIFLDTLSDIFNHWDDS